MTTWIEQANRRYFFIMASITSYILLCYSIWVFFARRAAPSVLCLSKVDKGPFFSGSRSFLSLPLPFPARFRAIWGRKIKTDIANIAWEEAAEDGEEEEERKMYLWSQLGLDGKTEGSEGKELLEGDRWSPLFEYE